MLMMMSSLRDLRGDYHGRGMVVQFDGIVVLCIVSVLMMRSIRLRVELVVVGVFGIVGHGMIVLYKGKGSPAIKRPSGRRGVGNLNRQHWRLLVLLTMMLLLILIIQVVMTRTSRLLIGIVNGGRLVHGR
jgi:hypothetical protein